MTEAHREELKDIIMEQAIAWAVAEVDHEEIDRINILKASFKAMHLALDQLKTRPEFLLIDGNRFMAYKKIPHACMIKGDGRFASIAAASVLAKTRRDAIMRELHEAYPDYGWDRNKGYGTVAHREAIRQFGMSPYHRRSFQCLPPQLSLTLK